MTLPGQRAEKVRYGDDTQGYCLHVVDGGRTETAETIINHINKFYLGYHISHMVPSPTALSG